MFFVKTLAITFLVVVLMQVKWGEGTVEEHTLEFIQTSSLIQPLQKTAAGGVHLVQNSIRWLSQQVNQKIRHQSGTEEASLGGRASEFKLKRSEAVEKKQNNSDSQ